MSVFSRPDQVDQQLSSTPKGYDPETQKYYTSEPPPTVAFRDAVRCILDEVLGEFVFQSPSDRSRAVANLLLPALKMAGRISGRVPITIIEADLRGAGKGYFDDLRAACYGHEVSTVNLQRGGVGSPDEAFSQSLSTRNPFIQFDNVRGRLDSMYLEQFSTGRGSQKLRLFRTGYANVRREDYFVSVTSNGFDTTEDLADRSLIIRICHRGPSIVYSKLDGAGLLSRIEADHAHYLGCVFAIVREWQRRGALRTTENRFRSGFDDGIKAVDWIVQSLFGLPPMMDGHREIQRRLSKKNLGWLRRVCMKVRQAQRLGEPLKASDIGTIAINAQMDIPSVPENKLEDEQRVYKAIGSAMAELFRNSLEDTITLEGFVVTREIRREQPALTTSGTNENKYYSITETPEEVSAVAGTDRPMELAAQPKKHTLPAMRKQLKGRRIHPVAATPFKVGVKPETTQTSGGMSRLGVQPTPPKSGNLAPKTPARSAHGPVVFRKKGK